jgi:dCTP deaminase
MRVARVIARAAERESLGSSYGVPLAWRADPSRINFRASSLYLAAALVPGLRTPPPHSYLRCSTNPLDTPTMTIMSDRWITRMAHEHRMIEPFEGRQVRAGVVSYGVSSYGYDMRVAREFRIFTNVLSSIVDPKAFDPRSFVEFEGDVCIVPPNSFALARSVEYFRIPRNILTVTVGKSTYARCGIITNVTPFEPEWEGFVTLEISNTTPLPAKIYANEGIAQVLFFRGEEEPEVSYKDKGGKYQSQVGVTLPKL